MDYLSSRVFVPFPEIRHSPGSLALIAAGVMLFGVFARLLLLPKQLRVPIPLSKEFGDRKKRIEAYHFDSRATLSKGYAQVSVTVTICSKAC